MRMARLISICAAMLLVICALRPLPAQQYVFRVFQQPDGLNNLATRTIALDSKGFLWVGTENGIYRFNGEQFEHFGQEQGLNEVNIFDLYADAWGHLWVITHDNLYLWDGSRFHPVGVHPITPTHASRLAAEDATHLLVVEKSHLKRLELDANGKLLSIKKVFSDQLEQQHPELTQISSMALFSAEPGSLSGRIWLSCVRASRLVSLPHKRGVISSDEGLADWGAAQGLPDEIWQQIHRDRQGTIWVAGFHHVASLSRGAQRFVDRKVPDTDPSAM